jgi:hypothetical protein
MSTLIRNTIYSFPSVWKYFGILEDWYLPKKYTMRLKGGVRLSPLVTFSKKGHLIFDLEKKNSPGFQKLTLMDFVRIPKYTHWSVAKYTVIHQYNIFGILEDWYLPKKYTMRLKGGAHLSPLVTFSKKGHPIFGFGNFFQDSKYSHWWEIIDLLRISGNILES